MRDVLAVAGVLVGVALAPAARGEPQRFVFEASARRGDGESETRAAQLRGGSVYLRSVADSTVTRQAPLGSEVELPAGEWEWQAEAGELVTVGWNVVSAGPPGSAPVRAKATAVPGCRVELVAEPRLKALRRLEVVAIEEATIYRLELPERTSFTVPQGRFFVAGFGPQSLLGLSGPHHCRAGEPLSLPAPSAPKAQDHALLLHLELPPERAKLKLADLVAVVRPSSPRERLTPAIPTALVWMGPHGAALFPKLPAASELEWVMRHPQLRTLSQAFPALGGGATAPEALRLRRRPTLTLPIDYRPLRPHRLQRLRGYYCGSRDQRQDLYIRPESCQSLPLDGVLKPGLHSYSFPDLDDGQYVFHAEIDDETVQDLGSSYQPYLAPADVAFAEPDPLPLRELHLWGSILKDGAPVPGEVRLVPVTYPGPTRVFPTDDELLYHWYYFGYLPFFNSLIKDLPGAAHSRSAEELRGLYGTHALSACAENGPCRAFAQGFTVAGGGRLDLDLGEGGEVAVRVTDQETGAPLAGAWVESPATGWEDTFHFFEGKTVLHARRAGGPSPVHTDDQGRSVLRLPAGPGEVGAVKLPDYKPKLRKIEVPREERVEVELALERQGERDELPRFVLPDGTPLGRAFLQVFDEHGQRRPGCHGSTLPDGRARFSKDCLAGGTVAVLHPRAAVTFVAGDEMVAGDQSVVEPAPRVPLMLRLVDGRGRALPGAAVELRYGAITLDPRDFAVAQAVSGEPMISPADVHGEIVLRGVSGSPSDAPEVAVWGAERFRPLSLAGVAEGEPLEISVR